MSFNLLTAQDEEVLRSMGATAEERRAEQINAQILLDMSDKLKAAHAERLAWKASTIVLIVSVLTLVTVFWFGR